MMSASLSVILVKSFRDKVGEGSGARSELICSTSNQEFLFNHKQLFILTALSVFNFDPLVVEAIAICLFVANSLNETC